MIAVFFLLICAQSLPAVPAQTGLLAGNTLTLAEAEKFFIENNLELKAKKADLKRYDAVLKGAGLLPNPTLKYGVESLNNGKRETEETYSISQSINLVRKSGLRMETALKRKTAQYLLYEQDILNSVSTMKQVYYKLILLKENTEVIKGFHDKFMDMENKTAKRFEAGDVSEVELMRLRSERKKLERLISGMKLEIKTEQRNLELFLNLPLDDVTLKERLNYEPIIFDAKELFSMAMEKNGDLKAASAFVDAAISSLNLSKKEAVMPVDIEAGYKKRTGGFNGFVFGVSIPLPLFSRNQDGIASAAAELETEKIRKDLIKNRVLNEINLILDKMTFLSARITDISGQVKNTREITHIVFLLYEEGETGLVEMLDAVRSETESAIEYNNLIYEYITTLFEIEKVTGVNLMKNGGIK
jgi:cobalt-zinc-cadmium efflux system outer membrane protein